MKSINTRTSTKNKINPGVYIPELSIEEKLKSAWANFEAAKANYPTRLKPSEIEAKISAGLNAFIKNEAENEAQIAAKKKELMDKVVKNHDDLASAYYSNINSIWAQIQALMEEDEGVVGNPKLAKAWSLAWEDGHSAGHYEVANIFRKYADLIK